MASSMTMPTTSPSPRICRPPSKSDCRSVGSRLRPGQQAWIADQYGAVQIHQFLAGVEAELLAQDAERLREGCQRAWDVAAAVLGEHERFPGALAEGMARKVPPEVRYELAGGPT